MSHSLTTHKILNFVTRFWRANCTSFRGHRTPLMYGTYEPIRQNIFAHVIDMLTTSAQDVIFNVRL